MVHPLRLYSASVGFIWLRSPSFGLIWLESVRVVSMKLPNLQACLFAIQMSLSILSESKQHLESEICISKSRWDGFRVETLWILSDRRIRIECLRRTAYFLEFASVRLEAFGHSKGEPFGSETHKLAWSDWSNWWPSVFRTSENSSSEILSSNVNSSPLG